MGCSREQSVPYPRYILSKTALPKRGPTHLVIAITIVEMGRNRDRDRDRDSVRDNGGLLVHAHRQDNTVCRVPKIVQGGTRAALISSMRLVTMGVVLIVGSVPPLPVRDFSRQHFW